VDEGIDPEFKPQFYKKKKKNTILHKSLQIIFKLPSKKRKVDGNISYMSSKSKYLPSVLKYRTTYFPV
jgi:hypothetical protein